MDLNELEYEVKHFGRWKLKRAGKLYIWETTPDDYRHPLWMFNLGQGCTILFQCNDQLSAQVFLTEWCLKNGHQRA